MTYPFKSLNKLCFFQPHEYFKWMKTNYPEHIAFIFCVHMGKFIEVIFCMPLAQFRKLAPTLVVLFSSSLPTCSFLNGRILNRIVH